MSENTELANRVLSEIDKISENYGRNTDSSYVSDEFDNVCEYNERFVHIAVRGEFTSPVLTDIMKKPMVYRTKIEDNNLIIKCCVSKSRYV